jgi:hypothetical protein
MDSGNIRHNSQNEYKKQFATRTPQKTGGDPKCSRMLSSSWSHFKKEVIAKFARFHCATALTGRMSFYPGNKGIGNNLKRANYSINMETKSTCISYKTEAYLYLGYLDNIVIPLCEALTKTDDFISWK